MHGLMLYGYDCYILTLTMMFQNLAGATPFDSSMAWPGSPFPQWKCRGTSIPDPNRDAIAGVPEVFGNAEIGGFLHDTVILPTIDAIADFGGELEVYAVVVYYSRFW
jgi:hypothetical protein